MSLCWITLFLSIFCIYTATAKKDEITFFALTNLGATNPQSIVGAEWLAIREINNNSELLGNYTLKLEIYDYRNVQSALVHSLDMINRYLISKEENDTNIFPMILGAPWSSVSTLTASMFNVINIGQLTGGATSAALSDRSRYPYFYRNMPSDALQASGLIILCNQFNWTKIAVVYINDAFGLGLSLEIQELANLYNIEVTSIAVSYDDVKSYNHAAKQIKDINIYIIIVVVHNDENIFLFFQQFSNEDITRYPYFYLGVDSWFFSSSVLRWNLTQNVIGSLGTIPWLTTSLPLYEYDDNIREIVEIAQNKSSQLADIWTNLYKNGYSDKLYMEIPGNKFIYGYDALYTLIYAMQQIEIASNLNLLDLINLKDDTLINLLNEEITNNIDFIGASGRVIFDKNGDRKDGLYSFGNIYNDGSVEYFGYFYQDINGTIEHSVDYNKIIWPSYFTEKGIIPHSETIIYQEILTINHSLSIIIFIVSSFCILIILGAIIFVFIYRKNKIIKRSSWRLNIIMCFGCFLSFISVILFGFDEYYIDDINILNILCELRLWIIYIAFTVMTMPLFLKTWRLHRIFSVLFRKNKLNDNKLFILLIGCIIIDIVLLTIFMLIDEYSRIYKNGRVQIIDELQEIEEKYGICSFHHSFIIFYFYMILGLWKFAQLLFGFYVAMNVSRIHHSNKIINANVLQTFSNLDETGAQLTSIMFTVVIICIAVFIFAFIPSHLASINYAIVAVSILLVSTLIFVFNLSFRIFAVISKNTLKFDKSAEQIFKEKLKKQILTMNFEKSWLDSNLSESNVATPSQIGTGNRAEIMMNTINASTPTTTDNKTE